MKTTIFEHSRKMAWGAVLAVGLFSLSFSAQANEWDKKTKITIDQPMQIADTFLQPGTYTLKLYNSNAERHVVEIWNADETHIINTVMANRTEKAMPSGHSQFTFYETPAGTAKAVKRWYYPGDISGNEFMEPKHPQQIDVATTTTTTTPTVVSDETNSTTTTTTATDTTPQPEPVAAPPVETQPAQPPAQAMDQDQTPVPTPAPAPVVDQSSADRVAAPPEELPKTASPYPLFGLGGLALAGFAGLLLTKRTA